MENINSCPLCLEDIEGEYIDKTGHCNCKIKYHKECLILLQKEFICPICRIKKNKFSLTVNEEQLFSEYEDVLNEVSKLIMNNFLSNATKYISSSNRSDGHYRACLGPNYKRSTDNNNV